MNQQFNVITVSGDAWIDRIARFRFQVWKANKMIDVALFPKQLCLEEVDRTAIHIVIETGEELIAASRFTCYADIDSTHHGNYYKRAGLRLEGRVAIPEHTVVRPDMVGKGLHKLIIDEVMRNCLKANADFTISECSPAAATLLKKLGRVSMGKAPDDPRFPGIEFEFLVSDVKRLSKLNVRREN